MAKKEKKITVKFVCNKSLKESYLVENDRVVNLLYPVYVLIRYDKNNVRIRYNFQGKQYYSNEALSDMDALELDHYERFIQDSVRSELKQKGDQFSLNGLGNRLSLYQKDVRMIFSQIYFDLDFEEIEKKSMDKPIEYFLDKHKLILECLNMLEKSSLTLFHWVFRDLKSYSASCLTKSHSLKQLEINNLINFLDRYIKYRLGE